MLKATGTLSVQPHKGRIVLDVSYDIVRYYASFIQKRYWVLMNLPLHGAHITIFNDKFHKTVNWKKAMEYHGKTVEFDYDEDMREGGFTKGFIMFYMMIYSDELERMKSKLGVVENAGYKGLHLTLGSIGKSGAKVVKWWPETIELR